MVFRESFLSRHQFSDLFQNFFRNRRQKLYDKKTQNGFDKRYS